MGEVRLVPFEREMQPGSLGCATQSMIDAVLANYGDRSTLAKEGFARPVQRATLIEWPADDAITELSEDELASRFSIGQWLTFSALAGRSYGSHWGYCNADDMQLVAQRFDPARPGAIALTSRRRDGAARNYMSPHGEAPIFTRPHHAQANRIELDVPLIKGLLAVSDPDLRERLLSSVTVFNRANTDGNGFPPASEITLLRVAFETLLGSGHETKNLQAATNTHFSGELPQPPVWADGQLTEAVWRATHPRFVARPLDAWIQDFCAARNRSSHGKSPAAEERPAPVWSIHNHLLFGSWLFPLMVKKVLADAGHYTLSELDQDRRSGMELFFAHDILSLDSDERLLWSHVEDQLRYAELGRAVRAAAAEVGGLDDDDGEDGDLVVVSQDVVPVEAESGGRRFVRDSGVGPAEVVMLHPGLQLSRSDI